MLSGVFGTGRSNEGKMEKIGSSKKGAKVDNSYMIR